jgi:hypothetical protein
MVSLRDLTTTKEATFSDPRADAWSDVPAVVHVEWPPDVRPLVERASTQLHEALDSSGCPIELDERRSAYFHALPNPRVEGTVTGQPDEETRVAAGQDALDALVWQWTRVAAATLEGHGVGRFISCLRSSRPPLLPTPRARVGLTMWVASADAASPTSGATVMPFLQGRAVMRAATGLLTLDPASVGGTCAGPPIGRPFHLFALPSRWTPEGDGLRSRQIPWSTMLEPDVLTDRGLGACRIATTIDTGCALVTRYDGTGSYVVDQYGRPNGEGWWPRRIDGEIACGRGGRLAWCWDGASHLQFRPAPGEPVVSWGLPVAPLAAVDDGESSAILATADGLWRWRADSGPQRIAPGPALVALHRFGTTVRAYERPTVLPDGRRVVLDRAFDWTEGAAVCTERAITPGEASFAHSTQGSWTAEALMDASAVRITHASGATFWLACSGPRSAAWAGRSLLVTLLAGGDVLLFRDLLGVIEPLVAAMAPSQGLPTP